MPIKLRIHKDQTTGPVFVCDVCGGLIIKAELANCCWSPDLSAKPGDLLDFKICCKEGCISHLDNQLGHQYTIQLDVFLVYLMNNSKFSLKNAKRTAELLSLIG